MAGTPLEHMRVLIVDDSVPMPVLLPPLLRPPTTPAIHHPLHPRAAMQTAAPPLSASAAAPIPPDQSRLIRGGWKKIVSWLCRLSWPANSRLPARRRSGPTNALDVTNRRDWKSTRSSLL